MKMISLYEIIYNIYILFIIPTRNIIYLLISILLLFYWLFISYDLIIYNLFLVNIMKDSNTKIYALYQYYLYIDLTLGSITG